MKLVTSSHPSLSIVSLAIIQTSTFNLHNRIRNVGESEIETDTDVVNTGVCSEHSGTVPSTSVKNSEKWCNLQSANSSIPHVIVSRAYCYGTMQKTVGSILTVLWFWRDYFDGTNHGAQGVGLFFLDLTHEAGLRVLSFFAV